MKKKHLKTFLLFLGSIPAVVLIYLGAAFLLSVIPVNRSFKEAENGIDIYVKSNGVHTDIVVPVTTPYMDWTSRIRTEDFQERSQPFQYISFGWGDKGFYLYTPTWADLKFSTAFKAMFWMSTSAMHVSYFTQAPAVSDQTRRIRISGEQYQNLIAHIDQSFRKDGSGKYELIGCCHYNGLNDNFYEGKGTYNLFRTCNGWTNEGLKKAGVTTAAWAPFEWSIMRHLK